jgi:ubiquinone/menaquinone biosynthesis C-methylase UbiE
MNDGADAKRLNEHYGRERFGDAILEGLRAAGKDPEALVPDDLAPVDHFHIRGKEATLALARLAGVERTMHVLDVGGGLGGAARTLAHEFGSRVTVLDFTEEYCRVGEDLTRRARLQDRVTFRHGDALAMPFAAESFDLVWTQHSSRNIDDKERLYREVHRVLRRGGRLALHEIVAGPNVPIHFPVPWARDASLSFLRPATALRGLLRDLGFREVAWVDVSTPSLEWYRARLAAPKAASAPPLGLHLLLGADFGPMFRNQILNLEEARIVVIKAVLDR